MTPEYTEHFKNWLDKFFQPEIKVLEYKSKRNPEKRFTKKELEKMYQKAMIKSPFNNKL